VGFAGSGPVGFAGSGPVGFAGHSSDRSAGLLEPTRGSPPSSEQAATTPAPDLQRHETASATEQSGRIDATPIVVQTAIRLNGLLLTQQRDDPSDTAVDRPFPTRLWFPRLSHREERRKYHGAPGPSLRVIARRRVSGAKQCVVEDRSGWPQAHPGPRAQRSLWSPAWGLSAGRRSPPKGGCQPSGLECKRHLRPSRVGSKDIIEGLPGRLVTLDDGDHFRVPCALRMSCQGIGEISPRK